MDYPVDGRRGGHGVGEDALPLGEDQVGRDAQRPPFVAFGDEGEEDLGLLSALREVAEIVQEQKVEAIQLAQLSGQAHCLTQNVTQRKWLPQIKCYRKCGGSHVGGGISRMAKQELLVTLRERYRSSSRKDKSRILDEFIAITGHHRKHGIRLLGQLDEDDDVPPQARGQRIYDEAVREVVIMIWEAADRICGKRLKAAMPHLVESMERHGHLALDPEIRDRLLAASAATLDRLLKPIRPTAGSRRRRRA